LEFIVFGSLSDFYEIRCFLSQVLYLPDTSRHRFSNSEGPIVAVGEIWLVMSGFPHTFAVASISSGSLA
jgi:hypothetical protein